MEADQFLDFCDENGIGYKTNAVSIIMLDCPAEGCNPHKVYFYQEPSETGYLNGKCQKCSTKYSHISYLRELGYNVRKGQTHLKPKEELFKFDVKVLNFTKPPIKELEQPPATVQTSNFINFNLLPKHETSKYAVSRGASQDLKNLIRVDISDSSVVFLVIEDNNIIGWQKRYVRPSSPKKKTKTSPGFQAHRHILVLPNTDPNAEYCVCEGPFTALAAWHFGFHGVCTFGAGVSEEQAIKIVELVGDKTSIAIGFDNDKPGQSGYEYLKTAFALRGKDSYKVLPNCLLDKPEWDLNDAWMNGRGYIVEQNQENGSILPLIMKGF